MKIGIHKTKTGFDSCWIEYCEKINIDYKIVDCYANDIVSQVCDCDVVMWHYHHLGVKDVKFARQLLFSLQQAGKKVFPDFNTAWYFDDKVGQKYLLEAIGAPMAPSYVFYTKRDALSWIGTTHFPKVFKLRGGAGSSNVKLAKNRKQACAFVRRAFGRGFSQYSRWDNLKERWRKYRLGKTTLYDVFKGVVRCFYTTDLARMVGPEKGYAYFQDFMPANAYDLRVIVIDGKAFAIKRIVRDGDFRASGSGKIIYDHTQIDLRAVQISFETVEKLGAQCTGFDFVFDEHQNPLIVEMGYGFAKEAYWNCEGYWDRDMNWHEGKINPYGWMVDTLIRDWQ